MPEPAGGWYHQRAGWIALALAAVLAFVAGVRLIGFAGTSVLFVDECWHAMAARMMAEAGGLVTTTTAMVVGRFHLDYPPLFHLLSAVGYSGVGSSIFVYFNLAVAAALVALILVGPGGLFDPVQRASLALALVGTPLFTMYSLRFYAEMLTTALFFCSWWWFVAALRNDRRRDAVIAGMATGLLVWTKQTGFLVLGLYGAFWVWTFVRGDRAQRRTATWVVAVAALMAAAYVGVMLGRGENPVMFALPTNHPDLWSASMVRVPFRVFFHTLWATWGVLPFVLLFLPVAVLATNKRHDYPYAPLVALLGLLVAVFLIDRRLVERHTLFLLPVIAFLGVDALTRLGGRPGTWAGFAMILAAALGHVFTMPNYRVNFNPSRDVVEMVRTIVQRTPPDATIASVWWAELRYHTGRQVLWPLPNLEDPPLELFNEQAAGTWYERARARKLDYVLVDDRYVSEGASFGMSWPLLANLDALTRDARVILLARAGPLRLFQVR